MCQALLPKFYSGRAVRIGHPCPHIFYSENSHFSVTCSVLGKTLLSSRTFTSLAIVDVHNVQQCRMLESQLNTDCLMDPDNSITTIRRMKPKILKCD